MGGGDGRLLTPNIRRQLHGNRQLLTEPVAQTEIEGRHVLRFLGYERVIALGPPPEGFLK